MSGTVTLTESQLAAKLRMGLGAVVALLHDCEQLSIVERGEGNRWTLSEGAETRFGAALRDLEPPREQTA